MATTNTVTGKTGQSNGAHVSVSDASPADIRAWAKKNGHKVSETGRIAGTVKQAYAKAHPSS